MTDIVDRLRVRVFGKASVAERLEAADEIVRLRKERDEWLSKWMALAQAALILSPEAQSGKRGHDDSRRKQNKED